MNDIPEIKPNGRVTLHLMLTDEQKLHVENIARGGMLAVIHMLINRDEHFGNREPYEIVQDTIDILTHTPIWTSFTEEERDYAHDYLYETVTVHQVMVFQIGDLVVHRFIK